MGNGNVIIFGYLVNYHRAGVKVQNTVWWGGLSADDECRTLSAVFLEIISADHPQVWKASIAAWGSVVLGHPFVS